MMAERLGTVVQPLIVVGCGWQVQQRRRASGHCQHSKREGGRSSREGEWNREFPGVVARLGGSGGAWKAVGVAVASASFHRAAWGCGGGRRHRSAAGLGQ